MNRTLLALLFAIFIFTTTLAQTDTVSVKQDTVKNDSTSIFSLNGIKSIDSLFIYPDSSKALPKKRAANIGEVLSMIINKAQINAIEVSKIKLELADALDTLEMSNSLPKINLFATRLKKQAEENNNKFNLRYLQGMENLILLESDLNNTYDKRIKSRIAVLTDVGNRLEEIKSDSLFNMTLRDTTLIPAINRELGILKSNIKAVDSSFLAQEIILARFQAKVSANTVTFLELQQILNSNRKQLERRVWTKEINYPWEATNFDKDRNIKEILLESTDLNAKLIAIYVAVSAVTISLAVIVFIALYFGFREIIKKISAEKEFATLILQRVEYFEKHTFWSSLIIMIPILLVVFTNPPLVFVSILSLLMVVSSTFLIKRQFGRLFHRYWLLFLTPYILLAFSGLHWKIAYQERWYVLLSSLIFIAMGYLIWKDIKTKTFAGAKLLRFISIFMIVMEAFAFFANIMGRFNLAKIYAVTGAITFYRAVGLFLFVQVCMEAVYLIIEYSKKENDGFTSYFDFQDLQKRMKGFLSIFATIIWIYGLLWHLGYYDHIYEWIVKFLSSPRVLGETEFEFGSILMFLVILFISTFLANNIAYFASIKDQKTATSRKQRLGSSILLIRLAVLIIGFFIGMTAAKIPFDKVAIVLGALSVGIGFGLQTIINNLVSGIILAFERPIQIGDEIQVGEMSGTVRDVGIRASKIQAYDGSEIVVPNGDLLSQSLVNWTLSDKKRRIELIIGVGYGSDMKLVKSVLEEVVRGERILKAPAPKVYMQTFNDSSVDFRVLFWVESMDVWLELRSEVMSTIFEKFAENEIEIPFPKRDLYLKSIPSNWQEKVSKPGEDISPETSEPSSEESPTDENKKSPED